MGGGGGPPTVCGDGYLGIGEGCDDGNADAGDACSPACKPVVFDVAADAGAGLLQDGPDVGTSGVDGGKGFAVVWRESNAGALSIVAATYAANGLRVGVPAVLSGLADIPDKPRLGSNGHVALFEQAFDAGAATFTRVTKREFQGPEASSKLDSFVSSSQDHDEKDASIASAGGKFVVAWTDNDVNLGDILAQVYDAQGARVGDPIQVNKTAPGGTQRLAKVAVNADGDAMFVWESEQAGVQKVSALIFPRLLGS